MARHARPGFRRRRAIVVGALVVLVAGAGWWLGAHALRRYYFNALTPAAMPPAPSLGGLGAGVTASTCGRCHTYILDEWRGSMHGRAMSDPLFVAEREQEHGLFACLRCHAPLHDQQPTLVRGFASLIPPRPDETPNPDFVPALHDEGVTCRVCHQRGEAIAGPLPVDAALTPHAAIADPGFASDQLCRRCHAVGAFPGSSLLRDALATFVEHDEYLARGAPVGARGCIDCHFPSVDRALTPTSPVRSGRSHRLVGARDMAFVRAYLPVAAKCSVSGRQARCELTIENRAGHRVPTGEPGRDLAARYTPTAGAGAASSEVHLLRRFDRIALVEKTGEDSTLAVAERRTLVLTGGAPGRLSVDLCLFEATDPLLAYTYTDYRSTCGSVARWEVSLDGDVVSVP